MTSYYCRRHRHPYITRCWLRDAIVGLTPQRANRFRVPAVRLLRCHLMRFLETFADPAVLVRLLDYVGSAFFLARSVSGALMYLGICFFNACACTLRSGLAFLRLCVVSVAHPQRSHADPKQFEQCIVERWRHKRPCVAI